MAKRLNALLPVVRWAVIGLAGAILAISITGLFRFPDYAARHLDAFTPNFAWTGTLVRQGLDELGWPPMTAAWFALGQDVFSLVLIYSISTVILWKKSGDWFGIFMMFVFIFTGPASGIMLKPVLEILPGLSFFIDRLLGAISWQLFFVLFFFFPTGRPVPSWTGWFAGGYIVFMLAAVGIKELNGSLAGTFSGTLMVVLAIGSQVYRYRRQPDAVQRQQTKWVVFVLAYFLLLLPVMFLFGFQSPPAGSLGPALLKDFGLNFMARLVFWLIPAAITIAVLRYRLWDIDLVIRRTLVYSILTAMLGLIYSGSVLILQQVFRAITGQDSPAVVVLSTLAIAFLFTPLRQRVQGFIDRRFYRSRYNAEQVLERFVDQTRTQGDLEELSGQLLVAVKDAIEPQAISLWLAGARGGPGGSEFGTQKEKK